MPKTQLCVVPQSMFRLAAVLCRYQGHLFVRVDNALRLEAYGLTLTAKPAECRLSVSRAAHAQIKLPAWAGHSFGWAAVPTANLSFLCAAHARALLPGSARVSRRATTHGRQCPRSSSTSPTTSIPFRCDPGHAAACQCPRPPFLPRSRSVRPWDCAPPCERRPFSPPCQLVSSSGRAAHVAAGVPRRHAVGRARGVHVLQRAHARRQRVRGRRAALRRRVLRAAQVVGAVVQRAGRAHERLVRLRAWPTRRVCRQHTPSSLS